MIHPATHIVAAATREGCPDDVAAAVAAAVLSTAATRLAGRGVPSELVSQWAREIREIAGLDLTPNDPPPGNPTAA